MDSERETPLPKSCAQKKKEDDYVDSSMMFEQGCTLDKGLCETWEEMGFMIICML